MRITHSPPPDAYAPVTVTLDCDTGPEEERLRWTLRPLTGREYDAAVSRAGAMPLRGSRAHTAALRGEELDEEALAAAENFGGWALRVAWQLAIASLVAVDGEPLPDPGAALDTLQPQSLWSLAVLQLGAHVRELSSLCPKARACYGSPSGSGGTQSGEGGSAPTATAPPGS
jgi:hypothetical protein